jgi:hypothetical protein
MHIWWICGKMTMAKAMHTYEHAGKVDKLMIGVREGPKKTISKGLCSRKVVVEFERGFVLRTRTDRYAFHLRADQW